MPEVGETITFRIGVHETTGKVAMVSPFGKILVEVAPEIWELVYEDEVVR